MKPFLFLALFASLAASASARIGETPDQLAKRYGTPISGSGTETIQFKKNDIYVVAKILNGTCQCIIFSNDSSADPTASVFGGGLVLPGEDPPPQKPEKKVTPPITASQIENLLQANVDAGGKWEKEELYWHTANFSRTASIRNGALEIMTRDFMKHLEKTNLQKEQLRQAEEGKRTDGF